MFVEHVYLVEHLAPTPINCTYLMIFWLWRVKRILYKLPYLNDKIYPVFISSVEITYIVEHFCCFKIIISHSDLMHMCHVFSKGLLWVRLSIEISITYKTFVNLLHKEWFWIKCFITRWTFFFLLFMWYMYVLCSGNLF